MTRPIVPSMGDTRIPGRAEFACDQCGYAGGFPSDKASPYIACNGDPTKHIREPVGGAR